MDGGGSEKHEVPVCLSQNWKESCELVVTRISLDNHFMIVGDQQGFLSLFLLILSQTF